MITKHYDIQTSKNVNLSIILLADIHGYQMGEDFYKGLRGEKPDAIMIAGDLVDEERPFSDHTEKVLQACVNVAPTWFSYGNNDEVLSERDIDAMKRIGVGVLDNEWIPIKESIYLGGLTSAMVIRCRKYGLHAREKVKTETGWLKDFSSLSGYKILLDHHPENYRLYTKDLDIDLILSGHTHGGQISVFGYGLLVPGQKLWPRYTGGYYEKKLIVSRGLSNTLPIPRIWNPKEIVNITIQSNNSSNKKGTERN